MIIEARWDQYPEFHKAVIALMQAPSASGWLEQAAGSDGLHLNNYQVNVGVPFSGYYWLELDLDCDHVTTCFCGCGWGLHRLDKAVGESFFSRGFRLFLNIFLHMFSHAAQHGRTISSQ